MKYTGEKVSSVMGGSCERKSNNVIITGVSTDTRKINSGDLFFCIQGENFDGHNFAEKAIEKGAVCVVAHKEIKGDFPVIYVKDTLKAYGRLAGDYKSLYNVKTVAVTGSVGKTSTKEFVAHLAGLAGKTLKNEANFNNEIGLPLTLFNLDNTYRNLVVEMGMRGKGQINYLCSIAKPKIAVISNISVCHIELLGSIDNIADAKCEILDNLPSDGYGIVNGDSEYLSLMKERCKCNLITFGEKKTNDIYVKRIVAKKEGFVYDLSTPWGDIDSIFLPGIVYHNVTNSMPAVATAKILGAENDAIREKIAEFKNIEKRFNIIDCGDYTVIDDSYNASPLAVEGALKTLRLFDCKRKIACLGEMYELGEEEADFHRFVGKVAKDCGIDELVCVGPLAKYIGEGFDNEEKTVTCKDSREAGDFMKNYIKKGDTVLIKGSHGVRMEKITEELVSLIKNRKY